MQFGKSHFYGLMILGCFIAFVFFPEGMSVPKWFTVGGIILLLFTVFDQSWEAFKRKGKACILDLELTGGGHSTIHPHDIRHAIACDAEGTRADSFTVFATGGFIYGGFEWQGRESFVVCPPEYLEDSESAMICHAKLRSVKFEQLPDFIQTELQNLKFFRLSEVKLKGNLYFGMTALIDGSASSENRILESKFLDQSEQVTFLKTALEEAYKQQRDKDASKSGMVTLSRAELGKLVGSGGG